MCVCVLWLCVWCCCRVGPSNKEEITLEVLKEAHAVVFGCPREKFSASEVGGMRWGGG